LLWLWLRVVTWIYEMSPTSFLSRFVSTLSLSLLSHFVSTFAFTSLSLRFSLRTYSNAHTQTLFSLSSLLSLFSRTPHSSLVRRICSSTTRTWSTATRTRRCRTRRTSWWPSPTTPSTCWCACSPTASRSRTVGRRVSSLFLLYPSRLCETSLACVGVCPHLSTLCCSNPLCES